MTERYWLVHPNGGRQLIDPQVFDLRLLAEQAHRLGGRLVVEKLPQSVTPPAAAAPRTTNQPAFEPPISALIPLFRSRFDRVHLCKADYTLDLNTRPTVRVLGGYYKTSRLVRVYSHDRKTGRRPLDELFDTFLHEMAHHLEYTEPQSFNARKCGRVPGRMHSPLFWRILGELKHRWGKLQRAEAIVGSDPRRPDDSNAPGPLEP